MTTIIIVSHSRVEVEGGWVPRLLLAAEVLGGWVFFSLLQRFLLRQLLGYHGWMFDGHGRRSFTTRIWGLGVRSLELFTSPQLYSYQASLPRLPVPALRDTCRRVSPEGGEVVGGAGEGAG